METLTSRVSELEAQVSSLEGEKHQAVETMKSALSSQADAEARAKEAVAAEEQTRAQMAVSGHDRVIGFHLVGMLPRSLGKYKGWLPLPTSSITVTPM